jgi:hypothetical protein
MAFPISLVDVRFFRSAAYSAFALLAGALGAKADTVSLPAAADTSIFSPYPDNDFGASTLVSGANGIGFPGRALFRFDLSSIPSDAVFTDAQITLTVLKVPPGDQHAGAVDSDFGLYPMLVSWQEGSGGGNSGARAQPGDTTWNERMAGVAAWGSPGGQIGTDFANNASTSTSIGTQTGLYAWGATPQLLSDLQSWLSDPSTNFGYMMISDGENQAGTARRFASLESSGPGASPPTLIVTYTVAPEPGTGILMTTGILCYVARRKRKTMDLAPVRR